MRDGGRALGFREGKDNSPSHPCIPGQREGEPVLPSLDGPYNENARTAPGRQDSTKSSEGCSGQAQLGTTAYLTSLCSAREQA